MKVKIIFDNNDVIYSSINCELNEAKKYYEGNVFNIGTVSDNLCKCVKIEEVK